MPDLPLHKPIKRVHRTYNGKSLALLMLEAGELTVCLDCGALYSHLSGRRRRLSVRLDKDGYPRCDLSKEAKGRRGPRRKNTEGRRRYRQTVQVQRVVMMAKLHAESGKWADLPPHIDVDHVNKRRDDCRAVNLRLRTASCNRSKCELDDDYEEPFV